MMPLGLYRDRTFSASNAMTFLVYAALGAMSFFLVLQLQTVAGYNALEAGLATLPITICMLFLAAKGGELGTRIGPRIPMTIGPLVMAVGTVLVARRRRGRPTTGSHVFPGVTVFGLGLALMVAPLTATVLAAAPDDKAGIASGINNAVARAGSLMAVAALPTAVGLSGDEYADPLVFDAAYPTAMLACAALLALGGVVSWLTIPRADCPPDHRPCNRRIGLTGRGESDVGSTSSADGGSHGSAPARGRVRRGLTAQRRRPRRRPPPPVRLSDHERDADPVVERAVPGRRSRARRRPARAAHRRPGRRRPADLRQTALDPDVIERINALNGASSGP